jgi:hypothetical protein
MRLRTSEQSSQTTPGDTAVPGAKVHPFIVTVGVRAVLLEGGIPCQPDESSPGSSNRQDVWP